MDGKKLDQDPMQMPSWSMGMACVWIVNRTPGAACRLWSSALEDALLNNDDRANNAIQGARTELINALTLGDVQATGMLPIGQRVSIPALEWEDMILSYDLRDDEGLVHRAESAGANLYTDIRVDRAAILARWPEQDHPSATVLPFKATSRRRGPKPTKRLKVIEAMRAFGDMAVLATMKEEAMAVTFSASRETCRLARQTVLSEFDDLNSDK